MAVTHLALANALSPGLDTIPDSRTQSPAPGLQKPAIEIALSSPFNSRCLTPVSSRGPSPAPSLVPSFHTARTGASPRRPSPAPLTIPTATVDEPLFSSYPFTPSAIKDDPLQAKNLNVPQASALAQALKWEESQASEQEPLGRAWDAPADCADRAAATGGCSRSHTAPLRPQLSMTSLGRRRSTTSVQMPNRKHNASPNVFGERNANSVSPRRRASLNTDDHGIERWRELGGMSRQFESSTASNDDMMTAYDFLRRPPPSRTTDRYTLEPVSMVSGFRPLSPPLPTPPPRSSSLIHSPETLLRLATLTLKAEGLGEHEDAGVKGFAKDVAADMNAAADAVSFVSEPLTSSPSAMTKSLPSTKTSLSRSARSGKEGGGGAETDAYDGGAAVATPSNEPNNCCATSSHRSQTQRVLKEKRRMIILEIIETEITYVHDLQALVHIYLPQLAALPHVPERIHSLVVRNTNDLLQFHVQFAAHLVDILKYSGMGYEETTPEVVDHVTKRVADLFVREVTSFSLYADYCAGSTTASALLRSISHRTDYDAFEKRCQHVSSATANPTLRDLLFNRPPRPCRSRHRFQDLLISPVQRVCRYPLLLAALLADVNRDADPSEAILAVQNAQDYMRAVAASADDARQFKEAELKTITIAERFEPHPAVSDSLLEHLGICRLGGALDVLYHHPQLAPLEAAAKVKYLAAFLYRGYLILAKVKRGNRFEIKHYLPLEAFELIDITEGFLPHSIRLTLREHHFDLAASCDAEKEVWTNELVAARNESTVPPFELPSSVSVFGPPNRSNGASNGASSNDEGDSRPTVKSAKEPNKRHTVVGVESLQIYVDGMPSDSPAVASPLATPASEYRRSRPGTLLLRRASGSQRVQVDRALSDVIFETLATARSKAQLQYTNSASDSRRSSSIFDTPKLRRRLSFAESTSNDVVASPEVRGAVVTGRRSRPRTMLSADGSVDLDSGMSREISRSTSCSSFTDIPLRGRHSSVSLRRGFEMTPRTERMTHRRHSKSISSLNLETRYGTRSVPASPTVSTRPIPAAEESVEVIKDFASPPLTAKPRGHQRTLSDESFVLVPEVVAPPPLAPTTPRHTPQRTASTGGTLRRQMSGFFSRRSSSSPGLHDMSEGSESSKTSKTSIKTLSKTYSSTSISSQASGAPQIRNRRRSIRLFGQLRGFTPI